MAARDEDGGGSLLSRLSTEMVRAQKDAWGKGPVQAKSYMFDDMLFIVMHDGLTASEQTMLGFGHHDLVRQYRQTFQNEMTARLTEVVESATGRRVLTYQSQILFDPHRVIEMFVFDRPAPGEARAATADGQVSEGEVGAAAIDDAPGPPAHDIE